MLDPTLDYSILEAAARRRWPGLFPSSLTLSKAEAGPPRKRMRATIELESAAADDVATAALPLDDISLEVVVRSAAPVFRILNGTIDLENAKSGQETWFQRIRDVQAKLKPRYPAIGRIEAVLSPYGPEPLGTGWLIDKNVVVTNAHVARYFAEAGGRGWRFRSQRGFDNRPVTARLDVGEDANSSENVQTIEEILYVSPTRDPDIAFLRISGGIAADPIPLFSGLVPDGRDVAVIGYPERDDSLSRADLEKYFGDVWGCKRFAPGLLGQVDSQSVRHLCNTLGGNSGSPLLDLETGQLLGLHYGGIPSRKNPVNYALPAHVVMKLFQDLKSQPGTKREATMSEQSSSGPGSSSPSATLAIPLTLTINLSLGAASLKGEIVTLSADATPTAPDLDTAVSEARRMLGRRDDVAYVRAGYKVTDGVVTTTPAIVVAVNEKASPDTLGARGRTALPSAFAGFPVDVAVANVEDLLEIFGDEEILSEASRRIAYRPRPDLTPKRLERRMKFTVRPGPDAGSGMLLEFLTQTRSKLTVGMYEFTAPHLVTGMLGAMSRSRRLNMVLQRGESIGGDAKRDDIKDEVTVERLEAALSSRFSNQWSATSIHPHYHIKVAAQDDRATWLSSGSWQSSNQPPDREKGAHGRYNREFHIIVEDTDIATLFRRHVEEDAVDAAAALQREAVELSEPLFWVPDDDHVLHAEAPLKPDYFPSLVLDREIKILPLLTPDNYAESLLPLIVGARRSILFHNQSFSIAQTRSEAFEQLLQALLRAQRDRDLDVRIIFRGNEERIDARPSLEKMQAYGFRIGPEHVRIQPRLHNKMWIIDDQHCVIGSHNFTNQGVTINRDASLILYDDPEIATYCRGVFDHDWERLAQQRVAEPRRGVRRAVPGQDPPPGMRTMSAADLLL